MLLFMCTKYVIYGDLKQLKSLSVVLYKIRKLKYLCYTVTIIFALAILYNSVCTCTCMYIF